MQVNTGMAVAIWTIAGALLVAAVTMPAGAAGRGGGQAPSDGSTVLDGVYSEDQHRRGQELAKAFCAACHGDALAGTDSGPTLAGTDFIAVWSGMSVGDLFDKIQTTMPADAPGSLKPQQTADLVAHILKLNDFPAGTTELGSELAALKQIRIRSRK
jgi:mono/diheme cytochrome c family protein